MCYYVTLHSYLWNANYSKNYCTVTYYKNHYNVSKWERKFRVKNCIKTVTLELTILSLTCPSVLILIGSFSQRTNKVLIRLVAHWQKLQTVSYKCE